MNKTLPLPGIDTLLRFYDQDPIAQREATPETLRQCLSEAMSLLEGTHGERGRRKDVEDDLCDEVIELRRRIGVMATKQAAARRALQEQLRNMKADAEFAMRILSNISIGVAEPKLGALDAINEILQVRLERLKAGGSREAEARYWRASARRKLGRNTDDFVARDDVAPGETLQDGDGPRPNEAWPPRNMKVAR